MKAHTRQVYGNHTLQTNVTSGAETAYLSKAADLNTGG